MGSMYTTILYSPMDSKYNSHGLPSDDSIDIRIKKYINVEKGPKRTLKKETVDGMDIYSHPNGICIYEGDNKAIFEYIKGKIIEEEKDRVIFSLQN